MVNTSKKNPPNFGCFSNIFEKFICKSNLPTHCCPPDEIPEKSIETKSDCTNKNDTEVVVRSQVQIQASPGIVARLMGLETLLDCENTRKSTLSHETLSRSKSLNSLHFLPDFDTTRAAFHRRARTSSASFREQGHTFLVKINEISEIHGVKMNELKSGRDEFKPKKPENRENVVKLKGNECRKSRKNNRPNQQESYQRSNNCISNRFKASTNNVVSIERNSREKCEIQRNKSLNKAQNMKVVSNVSRKKKVDQKKGMDVEVQSDVSTRSPVSVLDHYHEFDSPSRADDANVTLTTSPSRRKSPRKIKLLDDPTPQYTNQKSNKNDDNSSDMRAKEQRSVKNDAEVAEYFIGLSDQVCGLAEAQLSKDMTSDIRRYELFKAQFMDDLCLDFGQEIVEFLLNEITDELLVLSWSNVVSTSK